MNDQGVDDQDMAGFVESAHNRLYKRLCEIQRLRHLVACLDNATEKKKVLRVSKVGKERMVR